MCARPETPDGLVTHFLESLQSNRFTEALSLVAEDCEYDNVPIGRVFGKGQIAQTLSGFLATCTAVELLAHHQVSSGDLHHGVVMNERTDRYEVDGRWVELDVAGLFVVHEGAIALWRDYFDRAAFARSLAAH